jgi:hypothetical protein
MLGSKLRKEDSFKKRVFFYFEKKYYICLALHKKKCIIFIEIIIFKKNEDWRVFLRK